LYNNLFIYYYDEKNMKILITVCFFLSMMILPVAAQYQVDKSNMLGGGVSSGGGYAITGAIGQPLTTISTGATFQVASGFFFFTAPLVTQVLPSATPTSATAFAVVVTGANLQNITSVTISRLNSSGLEIGVVNLVPFISTQNSVSISINLPAGTIATGGTLTFRLINDTGVSTTADFFVQSDNIIVTNANNDGGGSLRRAFALTTTGGTIQIQGSLAPVQLTGGPIEVNKDVRLIDNNGGLEINGNGAPVFDVQCGGNLYLENVILTGAGNNPAIRNDCGTVILRRSRATGN
jgi:hypothetical protein